MCWLGDNDGHQRSERCKGRSESTSCNAEERSLYTGSTSDAKVQKTSEVPLVQCIDLIIDVTVCGDTKYDPSGQCRRRKKLLRLGFSLQQGGPAREIYPGSIWYGEEVCGQLPGDLSERFHSETFSAGSPSAAGAATSPSPLLCPL